MTLVTLQSAFIAKICIFGQATYRCLQSNVYSHMNTRTPVPVNKIRRRSETHSIVIKEFFISMSKDQSHAVFLD